MGSIHNEQQPSKHAMEKELRWNRQKSAGDTADLSARITEGRVNGRLSRCPLCGCGRLQMPFASSKEAICQGYFDKNQFKRVLCPFACPLEDAPRCGTGDDWFSAEPSSDDAKQLAEKHAKANDSSPQTVYMSNRVRAGMYFAANENFDFPATAEFADLKAWRMIMSQLRAVSIEKQYTVSEMVGAQIDGLMAEFGDDFFIKESQLSPYPEGMITTLVEGDDEYEGEY